MKQLISCYQHYTTQWHWLASGLQHETVSLSISDLWSLCFSNQRQSYWEQIWKTPNRYDNLVRFSFTFSSGAEPLQSFGLWHFSQWISMILVPVVLFPISKFIGIPLIICNPHCIQIFFFFNIFTNPTFFGRIHPYSLKTKNDNWIFPSSFRHTKSLVHLDI